MLHFFRLLVLLINIDQKTVLNWFGLNNSNNLNRNSQVDNDNVTISGVSVEPSPALSLDTLKLIVEGLWERIHDGLTLGDIENIVFFIVVVRFIILAIRYNLKTSFFITGIGLIAGYLWYRHLIDLVSMYRVVLLKLPFVNKLGAEAVQVRSLHRQAFLSDLKIGEKVQWYSPLQLIYCSIVRGIVNFDQESGVNHYIDPLSMVIASLKESCRLHITPFYYTMYNDVLPKFFKAAGKFSAQLSGVASYAIITRIGKKYCPYLIRWHWTLILIIAMVEQILVYFIYRVYYFQSYVLMPQVLDYEDSTLGEHFDQGLYFQLGTLNLITTIVVVGHIGLIIFGLFHAICGQYFYLPFFVENTELHVGSRPKHSIYSGGYTSWQEPEEREPNIGRVKFKFWYGWFGRGTKRPSKTRRRLKKLLELIWNGLKRWRRRRRRRRL